MPRFSDCFVLIFAQLAVGGAFGMAVPPFRTLERGFYKSSAGLFVGSAILFVAAKIHLLVRDGTATGGQLLEVGVWTAFSAVFSIYLHALWGDAYVRRARAFTATLGLGLIALVVSAEAYRPGHPLSVLGVLYAVPVITGAMAMGGVATGMLLGHWYLIDLGLSIDPMRRMFRFFAGATALHLAVLVVMPGLFAISSPVGAEAARALWVHHLPLVATRLLLGPVAALSIAYLIHRTLLIPQTMAATGLFYIAILFVMVGEMLGRLILLRTSLPL